MKSVSPKMSARSGLVGKILLAPFGPIWAKFFHGPENAREGKLSLLSVRYIPNHGDLFCHKQPKKRLKLDCYSPFGVRRGLKMIVSHRAPSSLNMSSYRAIWTHFRQNFIFVGPKNLRSRKIQTFPKMQISSSSHSHKYLTYMGR